ncbi:unnamed protein product, partial [Meganyctiphanes norvegica]
MFTISGVHNYEVNTEPSIISIHEENHMNKPTLPCPEHQEESYTQSVISVNHHNATNILVHQQSVDYSEAPISMSTNYPVIRETYVSLHQQPIGVSEASSILSTNQHVSTDTQPQPNEDSAAPNIWSTNQHTSRETYLTPHPQPIEDSEAPIVLSANVLEDKHLSQNNSHLPPKFDNCLPGCGYSGLPCFVCSTNKQPTITIQDTSEDGTDVITDTVVLVWLETLLRHRRHRQLFTPDCHISLAHYLRQHNNNWHHQTQQHCRNHDFQSGIDQHCYYSPNSDFNFPQLSDDIVRMAHIKHGLLQSLNESYLMDSRRNKWYQRTAGIALAIMIFIILVTLLLMCLMWLW